MLQFINTWNEFYFALMLTSGDTARTVPIALNYYLGTFANNGGENISGTCLNADTVDKMTFQ